MPIDLRLVIEQVFDDMRDPFLHKRGPRHRNLKAGLNLDRKHQNVVADVHKADPNKVNELEQLRGMNKGRRVISPQIAQELRVKYGIEGETGQLGTTGIHLVKNLNGSYMLLKESPENLIGKYDRETLKGLIFMATADRQGLIVGNLKRFIGHSLLLRTYMKSLRERNVDCDITRVGDFENGKGSEIDFDQSGIIASSANNPQLDGTYISVWSDTGAFDVKPLVDQLIRAHNYPGPYYLELSDTGGGIEPAGKLIPYNV
jgi:hypothetical protein